METTYMFITEEWIKCTHIHNGTGFSQKNQVLSLAVTCMELKDITLSDCATHRKTKTAWSHWYGKAFKKWSQRSWQNHGYQRLAKGRKEQIEKS